MIAVDISTAIFIYLVFALCGIYTVWVVFEEGGSFERYTIEKKAVWECDVCGYTYVDSTHDTISQCPMCHYLVDKENQKQGSKHDN